MSGTQLKSAPNRFSSPFMHGIQLRVPAPTSLDPLSSKVANSHSPSTSPNQNNQHSKPFLPTLITSHAIKHASFHYVGKYPKFSSRNTVPGTGNTSTNNDLTLASITSVIMSSG